MPDFEVTTRQEFLVERVERVGVTIGRTTGYGYSKFKPWAFLQALWHLYEHYTHA